MKFLTKFVTQFFFSYKEAAILITNKCFGQKTENCLEMIQVINRTLKRKNIIMQKSQLPTLLRFLSQPNKTSKNINESCFSNSWKLIKHYEILVNWNESLQKITKETVENLCNVHVEKIYLLNDDNNPKKGNTYLCVYKN